MVSRTTLLGLSICVLATALATAVVLHFQEEELGSKTASKRLLLPDVSPYTSFRCKTDTYDLLCTLSDTGEWTLQQPFQARANAEVVQRFLDSISCEKVQEQISRRIRRKRNLDAILSDVLSLEFSNSFNETHALTLKLSHDQTMLFAEESHGSKSDGTLFALHPSFLQSFPRFVDDFRDNHLVPFPDSRIGRIDISTDGKRHLSFQRTPSSWMVSSAQPHPTNAPTSTLYAFPGNEKEISRLLRYLARQRFSILHNSEGTPSPETLARVRCSPTNALYSVRLRSDDSSESVLEHELLFGSEVVADPNAPSPSSKSCYLAIPSEGILATIDLDVLASFACEAEFFREHALFPRITSDNLLSLRALAPQGTPLQFQRANTLSPWKLVQPTLLEVEEAPFIAFLQSLLSLSDTRIDPLPESTSTNLIATLELQTDSGAIVTSRLTQAASPTDLLCHLGEEPFLHTLPAANLAIRPWVETDILSLLRPPIPARIHALAPASIKEYGLLPAIETRTLLPRNSSTPLVLLLGETTPSGEQYAMIRGTYTVYSIPTNILNTLSAPSPVQDPLP